METPAAVALMFHPAAKTRARLKKSVTTQTENNVQTTAACTGVKPLRQTANLPVCFGYDLCIQKNITNISDTFPFIYLVLLKEALQRLSASIQNLKVSR